MSDEAKTVDDVVLPTLAELGYESSEVDEKIEGKQEPEKERESLAEQKEETKQEETQEEKEITYTETEKKAMEQGWTPKDQFKGDSSKWKDADTYLEHGELMSKISSSNKKINQLQRGVDDMAKLIKKQTEKLDKKERDELVIQRRAAIAESDIETVEAYDKKIKELETPTTVQPGQEPEVMEFINQNSDWFNNMTPDNAAMRAYAIQVESAFEREFPHMSLRDMLAKTREMVVKKYPSYFGVKKPTVNYKSPNPKVEGASQQVVTKKKEVTFKDMPADVRRVINNVYQASNRKINKDEYAQELVRTGVVEL